MNQVCSLAGLILLRCLPCMVGSENMLLGRKKYAEISYSFTYKNSDSFVRGHTRCNKVHNVFFTLFCIRAYNNRCCWFMIDDTLQQLRLQLNGEIEGAPLIQLEQPVNQTSFKFSLMRSTRKMSPSSSM